MIFQSGKCKRKYTNKINNLQGVVKAITFKWVVIVVYSTSSKSELIVYLISNNKKQKKKLLENIVILSEAV